MEAAPRHGLLWIGAQPTFSPCGRECPLLVRAMLLTPVLKRIDDWAVKHDDEPVQTETIRRLIEGGLDA